ncbi:acyl-CoA dehydrogenase/oxidase [Xylariales sp. PMI_506]|nr:acyl-CoA dehydrogenase/oxidase [Xylariales sp. PMI_506]
MPVDFHLSASEAGIRAAASQFASNVLKPLRAEYMAHSDHTQRFQATQPAYAVAAAGGIIRGLVSPSRGGAGGSLVESAIMVEECYAVEPSPALTIFATGLGLTPLNLTGKPEHREFLEPFLSGQGTPLAALAWSEPGGVANYVEKGAPGLCTTARRDGDEWVINGEKVWAPSLAGWDFRGADLACVVCRNVTETAPADDPKDDVMIILVTRADLDRNGGGCFQVLRHMSMAGHTTVSAPHVKYTNVRVPAKNVLCGPGGEGAAITSASFDMSAIFVGAMGVGLMRAAFDAALAFAKNDDRRGSVPLLERQAFADLLSGIKMKTEACRALTWKAAHALMNGPGSYDARRELALAAKIYCSDSAVQAVMDSINAVGVSAYNVDLPFAELLNNAVVLPIFDGGNVGTRRRHMQELMMSPTYDAWASTYGEL